MASGFKMDGLRELGDAFKTLSLAAKGRVGRAATGAAAKIVRDAAVANIVSSPSVETRSLHDAVIVKRVPPGQTALDSEHIVTVRGRGKPYNKKGEHVPRAPHAHLVEFGTVKMPAEPFLAPALRDNVKRAGYAMAEQLRRSIAAAQRAARKKSKTVP